LGVCLRNDTRTTVERGALFLATGKTHCEIGSAREENVETMLVEDVLWPLQARNRDGDHPVDEKYH
jgi:hypothetical protein